MTDPPPNSRPGPLRARAVPAAVALAATWGVGTWILVPKLIRDAHADRGLPILRGLVNGSAEHPVDEYLSDWYALAWRITLAALVVVVGGHLAWTRRRELAAWARGTALGAARRRVGPLGLLALAAGIGAATGLLEGVGVLVNQALLPKPNTMYRVDVLWAAPLVNVVAMLALSLPVGLLGRRGVPARPVAFALGTLGAFAALRGWAIGVLPYASLILAAALVSVAVGKLEGLRARTYRRLLAGVGSVVALAGIAISAAHVHVSTGGAGTPAGERRPNLLLIILDTVRARELSLYGYVGGSGPTTPRIDDFARDAYVFRRAVSPSSWTLPSHAGIFSGVRPTALRATWEVPFGDRFPTLGEVLATNGYATAGFSANYHYAGMESGIARGFQHFFDHEHRPAFAVRNSQIGRTLDSWWRKRTGNRQHLDRLNAVEINRAFLDWLPHVGAKPYFAFLNYYDAHDPYLPPEPPASWADDPPLYYYEGPRDYTTEQLAELQSAYDASLHYLDGKVGDLLDGLQETGGLENTIVIVMADHGELFGRHDPRLLLHGTSLYMASIRVPLIVRLPDGPGGTVWVDEPVATNDLAATLLELLELEAALPGNSFADRLGDRSDRSRYEDQAILSQTRPHRLPLPFEPIAAGPLESVTEDDLQYIRNGDGSEELYDIEADPWQTNPLDGSPDHAADLRRLRATLDSLMEIHGADDEAAR